MAKVTMYRGVDPITGDDSLFAVCEERVAPATYVDGSPWLKPESFGSFDRWCSEPVESDVVIFEALPSMTVIWEADL